MVDYKIKYELVAPDGTILTTNSGTYGNPSSWSIRTYSISISWKF